MEYLRCLNKGAMKLGTENIASLASSLSIKFPNKTKIVHVVGTNGKGSVCNKVKEGIRILRPELKVGVYTSPHISSIRERIKVNDEKITYDELSGLADQIIPISKEINITPTFFEALTLMGLLHFIAKKCDVIILEAGMGGRHDATNIDFGIPKVVALTNVDLEHTQHLGSTLTSISKIKAGVVAKDSDVIIGSMISKKHIIIGEAYDKKARSVISLQPVEGQDSNDENSEIARAVLEALQLGHSHVLYSNEFFSKLIQTRPPCRFELFSLVDGRADHIDGVEDIIQNNRNVLILDVAHNEQGLVGLRTQIDSLAKRLSLEGYDNIGVDVVFGLSNNKDINKCLNSLFRRGPNEMLNYKFKEIRFVEGDVASRAHRASDLLKEFEESKDHFCKVSNAAVSKSAAAAIRDVQLAHADSEMRRIIIVCGSFFIMSNVRYNLGIDPLEEIDPENMNEARII